MPELNVVDSCAIIKKMYDSSFWGMASTYAALFGALLTVATFIFGLKYYYDNVKIKAIVEDATNKAAEKTAEEIGKKTNDDIMLLYSPIIEIMLKQLNVFNVDAVSKLQIIIGILAYANSNKNKTATLPYVDTIAVYVKDNAKRIFKDAIFYAVSEEIRSLMIENMVKLYRDVKCEFESYLNEPIKEDMRLYFDDVKEKVRFALNEIDLVIDNKSVV